MKNIKNPFTSYQKMWSGAFAKAVWVKVLSKTTGNKIFSLKYFKVLFRKSQIVPVFCLLKLVYSVKSYVPGYYLEFFLAFLDKIWKKAHKIPWKTLMNNSVFQRCRQSWVFFFVRVFWIYLANNWHLEIAVSIN